MMFSGLRWSTLTTVSTHQNMLFIAWSSGRAMCFTSADNEGLRLRGKLESIRLRVHPQPSLLSSVALR